MKARNMAICSFVAFGCWLKGLGTVATFLYNIWYVLIITWCIINFVALCDGILHKKGKEMAGVLDSNTHLHWFLLTVLCLVSFMLSREYWLTALFMASSVSFFMFVTYHKDCIDKKKKK